ncbi:fumarylacetoacetate hydrolase family protein [Streptomyces ipomoeae]|uniref:FAH family protein n=1 Tax=Streptomyces ipomoeae 91-03 TaxID=698759 RepID=L1L6M9_9ACTN|nr:fumarylacetoacetate hydrolase family protein [Streptomyces ipomoeae]EKX68340.1 FAH family protein [Streptomyces ipomoeae 91-03]MDX2695154.1 fumarylacetoacetate hydrolase family protein [Streptomyces ipomoeae]MDX2822842.1 fumarylacetoacetate hydrolase family protein [Streptomyces ipomoeae]MDX2841120.1 fumarylacetoacetate hydrolase family protein [Streptomyces ipomoeae]
MPHPLGNPPSKVIAVHLNYPSRAKERGRTPKHPSYFLKPPSSLSGTQEAIVRPTGCELLGFEGEIALVIGSRAQRVRPEDGWAHVRWVTAANDAGVYDLRYADRGSNLRSKGADGFTPIGPRLLDARRLDPAALRLRTWVNGEPVQDDTTDTLLFPFGELVADLSRLVTLEPGDVILTGTPAGASVVSPGDVVEVEVTGGELSTGRLRNPIADGPALEAYGAMPKADPAEREAAYGSTYEPEPLLHPRLAEGLRSVAVATLSAQLRGRGLPHMSLDGVHPVTPGTRMVGVAHTLRYLPLREDLFKRYGTGMNAQKRAIEELRPGHVLVMDARRDPSAGTLGDILALRAHKRGAAGVVTDGAVRDSAAVADLGLPVYAAGAHPSVLGRRHVPWDTGVPIACGGALVQPGDLIVGDDDGVVVVPPDLAEELIADSREQERQERFITEQVTAGESVDGLYPLGPAWRDAYENWCRGETQ